MSPQPVDATKTKNAIFFICFFSIGDLLHPKCGACETAIET
jgi:hypothetical protein